MLLPQFGGLTNNTFIIPIRSSQNGQQLSCLEKGKLQLLTPKNQVKKTGFKINVPPCGPGQGNHICQTNELRDALRVPGHATSSEHMRSTCHAGRYGLRIRSMHGMNTGCIQKRKGLRNGHKSNLHCRIGNRFGCGQECRYHGTVSHTFRSRITGRTVQGPEHVQ